MKIKSLYLSCLIIDLAKLVIFFSFFFIIIYLISDFYIINFFTIYIDYFYLFFRLLFLIFFLFCLFASKNVFFLDKIYLFEFPILIFLSAEGSFLMLMTDNLFTFYLALEMQNLCFYILASLKRYSNFSTEAGLKYFLLGAFSSSILLFGISLLYGILGTLDLKNIYILLSFYNFEHYNLLLFISFFFLLSGLLFKLGSAPFHY
jgi:NADH:ubiquinone oxidoreductase subunit 2 (subunit N)